MASTKEQRDFIRQNINLLIPAEMTKALKIDRNQVAAIIKELGLKALDVTTRNSNYILANHRTMTEEQITANLKLGHERWRQYIRMLGLKKGDFPRGAGKEAPAPGVKKGTPLSPGAILSGFRFGNHHYNDPLIEDTYRRIDALKQDIRDSWEKGDDSTE